MNHECRGPNCQHARSARGGYHLEKAMAHFGRAMAYGAPAQAILKHAMVLKSETHVPTWLTRTGTYYYDGGKFLYEYVKGESLRDTILVWLALYPPQHVYNDQPKLRAIVSISGIESHLDEDPSRRVVRISAELEPENDAQDPLAYRGIAIAVFNILRNHVARYYPHSISFGIGWPDEFRTIPKRTSAGDLAELETYDTIGAWIHAENVRNEDRVTKTAGVGEWFDSEVLRNRVKRHNESRAGHDKENTRPTQSPRKEAPRRDPMRDITRQLGGL